MKRGISLLLCLVLTMGLFPALSAAASEYDADTATYFVFSDDGIAVTEGAYSGYKISGTELTLNKAGTYVVSGSCADGSMKVKKGTTGVTLVLAGLDLTSTTTAPLACNKSSAATVIAASGTVNTLTDSAYNNDDNYPENADAENAVIKCKDGSQVTLCGGGTLNLVAYGKNGIKAGCTTEEEGEAWLVIRDLTLNITATVNDGINAEQLLSIESGALTVHAADDGLHCDLTMNIGMDGSENSPIILIEDSYEGIEAATLNIYSGDITVHSQDDGLNAANSDLKNFAFSLNIYGGTLYVDAQNGDGIDSNGTLTISGGTVEVYSSAKGDNAPLDSDGTLLISGGIVLAVGQKQMAQTPASSSQPYVQFGGNTGGFGGGGGWHGPGGGGGNTGFGFTVAAGDAITVTDASGNVICTATALRAATYVIFSAPNLTVGATYTLNRNGSSVATAQCAGTAGSTEPIVPSEPGEDPPIPPVEGEDPPIPPVEGEDPPVPPVEGEDPPVPPVEGEDPPVPPVDPTPCEHANTEVRDAVEASCTQKGYTGNIYCADCGELLGSGSAIPAAGHSYTDIATAPTCTEKGCTIHTCSVCGDTYKSNFIDPLGHNYVNGVCTNCGDGTYDCYFKIFSDCKEEWYHEAVDFAVANGLMKGVGDGKFEPDESMTRGMIVTVLYRAAGSPAVAAATTFSDVPSGEWYADAIAWAQTNGIVKGVSETEFAPDEDVTREQIVTILWRYAGEPEANADLSNFKDSAKVSDYAVDAVNWAVEQGIVKGDEGSIKPLDHATRAEFACIIMRFLGGSYACG